jgi:hypothetical protein
MKSLLKEPGLTAAQIDFIKQRSFRSPVPMLYRLIQVAYFAVLLLGTYVLMNRAMEMEMPNWINNVGGFAYGMSLLMLTFGGLLSLFTALRIGNHADLMQGENGFIKCYDTIRLSIPGLVTRFSDHVFGLIHKCAWLALLGGLIMAGYHWTSLYTMITLGWVWLIGMGVRMKAGELIKSFTPEQMAAIASHEQQALEVQT